MSSPRGRPLHTRPEPTTTTIADFGALIAGVALASALEWYSGWGSQQGLAVSPAPRWYVVLHYVNEGVLKGLVAMIPVVVFRRMRYGGAFRPGEFLALGSGVPSLLLGFERMPALGLSTLIPGKPIRYATNMGRLRIYLLAKLVVFGLAVSSAAVFRRRLPPLLICLLLLGACLASGPLEFFTHDLRDAFLEQANLPFWKVRAFNDLLAIPFRVFGMVPLMLAVVDVFRHDRRGRTWVENACLGLALIRFLGDPIRFHSRSYLVDGSAGLSNAIAIDLLELFVATGLCEVIVWRYGPPLGRWLGIGNRERPS